MSKATERFWSAVEQYEKTPGSRVFSELKEAGKALADDFHAEAAQNALMRAGLLAAKSVLEPLARRHACITCTVEGRALLAVETALKGVGSVVPQEHPKAP